MNNVTSHFSLPRLDAGQICILIAITLAAAMTIFYTRLLSTSLPDLRGVWGLSYDEGSMLYTAATAPQLLVAPVLPWMLTVFGFRRILIPAAAGFVMVSFLIPFLTGFAPLLAAHALLGLILGCFVTATILIVLKLLPPPWWIIAFALFTFRVSLGTNTGVSLGALYMEFLGWEWIYWQGGLIMLLYFGLLRFALPLGQTNKDMLKNVDLSGMGFFCLGVTLLYIGMDQGERLGWLDSGVVTVCLFGGAALLAGFCWNERVVPKPWAPPTLFATRNICIAVCMTGFYIFMLTANSMLITQFLGSIQGLKPLQSGDALLLIALLQIPATLLCIWCVRRADARLTCAFGMAAMALACHQGTLVTADWVAADFIPMAMLFSVGHPFVFLSILAMCIASFAMETAPKLLAYVQFARISAGTACGAILTLFLRQRNDSHTTFLSHHLTGNDRIVSGFLESGGSLADLKGMVAAEATVLAVQDAFALCFWVGMVALALLAMMRPLKPTPISPAPTASAPSAPSSSAPVSFAAPASVSLLSAPEAERGAAAPIATTPAQAPATR